jgi:hypothetical protein
MKLPTRWTLLLHGIPLIVYAALAFVVYTKVTGWAAVERADKARLIEQTVETFKAVNAANRALADSLHQRARVVVRYVHEADRAKHTTDSTLARHPLRLAPAACAPYTAAVTSCQRETTSLRTAVDTLTTALKAAQANLARNRTTLAAGGQVLRKAQCHFPCLDVGLWLGPALTTSGKLEGALGLGIKIH